MEVFDTVTISRKEYEDLLNESLILHCLERNGVDNWDWWDDAMELYRELSGEAD